MGGGCTKCVSPPLRISYNNFTSKEEGPLLVAEESLFLYFASSAYLGSSIAAGLWIQIKSKSNNETLLAPARFKSSVTICQVCGYSNMDVNRA